MKCESLLYLKAFVLCLFMLYVGGCGSDSSGKGETSGKTLVVNSLDDMESPPLGVMTLRSAIENIESGGTIIFDNSLNGGTIQLTIVGAAHTILKGEVYAPAFQGYQERDYGKSALYAKKDLIIDASALPDGIAIGWAGDESNRARVLAVYGNLTMRNVTITTGHASAEAITSGPQPYTLARGGGIAVWGTATLEHCTVSGNRVSGDLSGSRDRGAYGGGIYANGLVLRNSIVSGNTASGYGAAGGGIYSVGGGDNEAAIGNDTFLSGCTVSGNRVTAQHAYGGGIFSLSGGPNNLASMHLTNCTIARNIVEDHPDLPEAGQYYYRGGGIYMGGGSLSISSCTIVENSVNGNSAVFNGKPNMGGGGVAATIGNAHVVENINAKHSIIAGNTLNNAPDDLFTGSLLHFYSYGYNLIGRINFDQILVPIPVSWSLSRKHWPNIGDQHGIAMSETLSLSTIKYHDSIKSAGVDRGNNVVLWYPPAGIALDQIPDEKYYVSSVIAQYSLLSNKTTDDFLNRVLEKLRKDYVDILGNDFGKNIEPEPGSVTWHGPAREWPSNPENADWIKFWRDLDLEIGDRLGTVKLGDAFWGSFVSGRLGDNLSISVIHENIAVRLTGSDQLGNARPSGVKGDIGAIEL